MTGDDADGWHDRVERYTPDGTVGRLLFGLFVGAPSAFVALFSLFVLFAGAVSVAELVLGPVFAVAGIAGTALVVTVLWPVYLSLIGNVERPAAYGVGTDPSETAADPVAVLKRRYADGEISRAEFERRLDGIVDGRSVSPGSGGAERDPRAGRTDDDATDRAARHDETPAHATGSDGPTDRVGGSDETTDHAARHDGTTDRARRRNDAVDTARDAGDGPESDGDDGRTDRRERAGE